MKTITLHQPHATFVELRLKWLETRSWAPPPAVIGERLLIHAAKRPIVGCPDLGTCHHAEVCRPGHCFRTGCCGPLSYIGFPDDAWPEFPLGAIVASGVISDAVPMVKSSGLDGPHWSKMEADGIRRWLSVGPTGQDRSRGRTATRLRMMTLDDNGLLSAFEITEQLPYGDFAAGRWAWLLEDIEPTTERCPACWGTGWLCDPHDVGDCPECCSSTSLHGCPICTPSGGCGGTGTTEPIPAVGHQRVWNWSP